MGVDLIDGIKWYLAFVVSTVFHEAAHAWTAQRLGDNTAALGGQVTLDPTPHIRREPIGMVAVPILSFLAGGWMIGWASAPYNAQWALQYPRRSATMALAGPVANMLLCVLALLLMKAGLATGFFQPAAMLSTTHLVDAGSSEWSEFAGRMLSIFFSLNLLLAVFNLLPLPPLDGSSAPMLLLPNSIGRRWMALISHPQFRFVGIFIAWNVFGSLFHPVQTAIVHTVFPSIR